MTPGVMLLHFWNTLIPDWVTFIRLELIHYKSADEWRANEATPSLPFSVEGCASVDPLRKFIIGNLECQEDAMMDWEDPMLTVYTG